jgi:hypothetical protein
MLKLNSIFNENIERYCMQIQFNSNSRKMGCKYGGKQIEHLFLNMVLRKKT